jgi:hypothetical protein
MNQNLKNMRLNSHARGVSQNPQERQNLHEKMVSLEDALKRKKAGIILRDFRSIAKKLGRGNAMVYKIIKGYTWKHVK